MLLAREAIAKSKPFDLSQVEACPEHLPWQAVDGGTFRQRASTSLSMNGQGRWFYRNPSSLCVWSDSRHFGRSSTNATAASRLVSAVSLSSG